MEKDKPKSLDTSSFTPKDVAELAAAFLPPLPLEDNWQSESPRKLQEKLEAEFAPGGNASMNEIERYELDKELLLNPHTKGYPSTFEVLAEAAVRRATILLKTAVGEQRPERIELEQKEATEEEQRWADEDSEGTALSEYRKKFGNRSRVSLDEAAKSILSRFSDNVRDGLLKKWCELSNEERRDLGFYGEPSYYQEHGVEKADYPDIKKNLLLCADHFKRAIQKDVQRKGGSKGGKKSQAKVKRAQAISTVADPSKPSRTPKRGSRS